MARREHHARLAVVTPRDADPERRHHRVLGDARQRGKFQPRRLEDDPAHIARLIQTSTETENPWSQIAGWLGVGALVVLVLMLNDQANNTGTQLDLLG